MSQKILIAYASNAGSTAEIAQSLGEQFRQAGTQVDVSPISAVTDINSYAAVILGAPMILGWHRDAIKFLKSHQDRLKKIPVACFIMSLELTRLGAQEIRGVPIYIDPQHGHTPQNKTKLSRIEKRTTEAAYLEPVLDAVPQIKPVSVAFFKGVLDYAKLGLPAKLFVRFIIGGKAGDYRNWEAIRAWANALRPTLVGKQKAA